MPHVSETYEARVQTSRERRRLSQIRKSFGEGIKQKDIKGDVPIEFFEACVNYIKASMDRLHAQDQRIHDFLLPHAGENKEGQVTLEHLNTKLARSRTALQDLVNAGTAYKKNGESGWKDFKVAVDKFMDVYFNILLSGQHSTLPMQEDVFDEQTWDKVAGVTPESLATEEELYKKVQGLAPDGADPATFTGGPPAPGAGPPGQGAHSSS